MTSSQTYYLRQGDWPRSVSNNVFSLGLGRQVISTEGALRRPLTYDYHTIQSNPNPPLAPHRPERHKMTLEELGRPPLDKIQKNSSFPSGFLP